MAASLTSGGQGSLASRRRPVVGSRSRSPGRENGKGSRVVGKRARSLPNPGPAAEMHVFRMTNESGSICLLAFCSIRLNNSPRARELLMITRRVRQRQRFLALGPNQGALEMSGNCKCPTEARGLERQMSCSCLLLKLYAEHADGSSCSILGNQWCVSFLCGWCVPRFSPLHILADRLNSHLSVTHLRPVAGVEPLFFSRILILFQVLTGLRHGLA